MRIEVLNGGQRFDQGTDVLDLTIADGLSASLTISQTKELIATLQAAVAEAERGALPMPAVSGVEAHGRLSGI
jgi:hypothetical protein